MSVVVPCLAAALVGIVLPAMRSWKWAAPLLAVAALASWGVSGHYAPALIVAAVGAFAFEASAAVRAFRGGHPLAIALTYLALALAFGGVFLLNPISESLEGPTVETANVRILRANPMTAIVVSLGRDPLTQPYLYSTFHAADYRPAALPRWHETAILFGGLAALLALHRLVTRAR